MLIHAIDSVLVLTVVHEPLIWGIASGLAMRCTRARAEHIDLSVAR
jgi:hypothetical protein